MPVFTYRGTNRTGTTVTGEQLAPSKSELVNMLRKQQIKVTKMSEKGKEFNLPTFGAGVDSKELAVFTRQFSVMIDAGLPLVQCLEILAGQQENKMFQKVLTGTRASVEAVLLYRRRCASTTRCLTRSTSTSLKPARRVVFSIRFCSGFRLISRKTSS